MNIFARESNKKINEGSRGFKWSDNFFFDDTYQVTSIGSIEDILRLISNEEQNREIADRDEKKKKKKRCKYWCD